MSCLCSRAVCASSIQLGVREDMSGVRKIKKFIRKTNTVFSLTGQNHVLSLRMEERPPNMEGSCEYIEQATGLGEVKQFLTAKN